MECSDIRRHLSAYIDNECPEDIREAVASHLADCPDCRREYEQLSALSQRMRQLPQDELPFDFSSVLAEKLAEEDKRQPRRKPLHKRGWVRALGLAACLVLVLGLFSLGSRVLKGAGSAFDREAAYESGNYAPDSSWEYEYPASDMTVWAEEDASYAQETEAAADSSAGLLTSDAGAMQRKIIMNWTLDLKVEDFDAVYQEIERIAAAYGGYVVNGHTSGGSAGSYRDGFIAIRVEAERARQAVGEIGALGELRSNDFSSQDVTGEYYDIAARLTAYEAQEQRLLELYGVADTVYDMLEIEDQLAAVRAQIESLQGTLKYYDQLTALSLIEISLYSPAQYSQNVEPEGWQGFVEKIKSNFLTGLNNTLDGLAAFLVWLAGRLPVLAVLALIAVVLVALIRRRRHKKRAKSSSKV